MKTVPTYTATIYLGMKATRDSGDLRCDPSWVYSECQNYCSEVGLCVTITPTTYIYKGGSEAGAIIGLINYPRFPKEPHEIRQLALDLAEKLRVLYKQYKVSVVFPDETVMLGEDKH